MWKWLIGGIGGAWLLYKLTQDTAAEIPSPTRVTWKSVQGEPQARDFAMSSVAKEFADALLKAGASSVQMSTIA